ncbi:glycopeptide antibiotics resistance protein [Rarobacter incanus]|uniref:Glycopeptide antibiotics resistance protein n=1 Tax=Rarobacter incanus TaxID=153494 RepID=A0A542SND1_9MICO|nr:glycopeptide antibiotics resistance protein [Rarobacter incanus]
MILGVIAFALIFVPLLIVQFRKFGALNARRIVGAAAVAIYGAALVSYTMFPMPSPQWCNLNHSIRPEFVPLHSIDDIARATAGLPLPQALTSTATLQVVFNVILFVPWGILVRRYFGRSFAFASFSGLAMSLAIEATQLTGVWGLVGCAYRVADIDDVITNTTGAVLGAALAPLILGWMPQARQLEATRDRARRVARPRRLVGMGLDLATFWIGTYILAIVYRAVGLYGFGRPLPSGQSWMFSFVPMAIVAALMAAPSLLGSGASVGQRLVWLEPRWRGRPRRAVRYLTGFAPFAAAQLWAAAPHVDPGIPAALGTCWLLLAGIGVIADKSARGISYRLARVELVDPRASAGGLQRPVQPTP